MPGVEDQADSDGFPGLQATLHTARKPWRVAWRCGHAHTDPLEAEACAVAEQARRGMDTPPPQPSPVILERGIAPAVVPDDGISYAAETTETWTIAQAALLERLGISTPGDARVTMVISGAHGSGEPKLCIQVKYQPRVA